MKKLRKILTRPQLERVRVILEKELIKKENEKYTATLSMYLKNIGLIAHHTHYANLLYFMRHYRTPMDQQIKIKIRCEYKNRPSELAHYRKEVQQKFYRYRRNDYRTYLQQAQYFFSLYRDPMNFANMWHKDYLNRAYVGMGFEFLLKAIFLKKGYVINEVKIAGFPQPLKQRSIRNADLNAKVYPLGHFVNLVPKLKPTKIHQAEYDEKIMYGLLLVQSWRNQDMHTPTNAAVYTNKQTDGIRTAYYGLYELHLKGEPIPKFPRARI